MCSPQKKVVRYTADITGIAKRPYGIADTARSDGDAFGSKNVSGCRRDGLSPVKLYRDANHATASAHRLRIGPAHTRKDGIDDAVDGP